MSDGDETMNVVNVFVEAQIQNLGIESRRKLHRRVEQVRASPTTSTSILQIRSSTHQ